MTLPFTWATGILSTIGTAMTPRNTNGIEEADMMNPEVIVGQEITPPSTATGTCLESENEGSQMSTESRASEKVGSIVRNPYAKKRKAEETDSCQAAKVSKTEPNASGSPQHFANVSETLDRQQTLPRHSGSPLGTDCSNCADSQQLPIEQTIEETSKSRQPIPNEVPAVAQPSPFTQRRSPPFNPYAKKTKGSNSHSGRKPSNSSPATRQNLPENSQQPTTATPVVLEKKLKQFQEPKHEILLLAAPPQPEQKQPTTTGATKESSAQNSFTPLPKGLRSFDKFFALLTRFTVEDYLKAAYGKEEAKALWHSMCKTVKISPLCEKIRARYDSADEHFEVRAALVLDGLREEISHEVSARWQFRNNGIQPRVYDSVSGGSPGSRSLSKIKYPWISVRCQNIEVETETDLARVSFSPEKIIDGVKKTEFTVNEQRSLGYGTMIECTIHGNCNPLWGVVVSSSKNGCIVMFYSATSIQKGDAHWQIRHLGGSRVPQFREFYACTYPLTQDVPFLHSILGRPNSKIASTTEGSCSKVVDNWIGSELNTKQTSVVEDFLSCPSGTLQIVQGPPGCGKTTLLVSLIRNYLAHQQEGRKTIMVCAPTNKAVSVLATRFVKEICPNGGEPEVRITVAGDYEKLSDKLGQNSILRPFHLFQFLNVIKGDIMKVLAHTDPAIESEESCASLIEILRRVQIRLKKRLPNLPRAVFDSVDSLFTALESYHASAFPTLHDVGKACQQALNTLNANTARRSAVYDDMIATTDVFFCTLYSAGSPTVSKARIDDLVVDEAAAATEPALYIPLSLCPSRFLIVGDPKQLPAVVPGKLANELGLGESLHERLMYRCDYGYTLLEEQYRMHPAIAEFPSSRFYADRITNGSNVTQPNYGSDSTAIFQNKPFMFYQVRGTIQEQGPKISNMLEAEAVVGIVKELSSKINVGDADKLRVITFYNAQKLLIDGMLREQNINNVFVGSVDATQGCEADIVIVSFVRGGSKAGFLKDDRRINVALTRAKHQLICVGNVYGLQELADFDARTLRLLAEDAIDRKVVQRRLAY